MDLPEPYLEKQVHISSLGYKDTIVNAKQVYEAKRFDMVEESFELDEVVVIGYGTQSRAKVTTSVSKLNTQILETSTRSNAATALQGTVSGLRVTNTTGQPGSTPQIVLRGGTNFDGTGSPLILIDGIPGSFYALNSDDIESIEVLKDAAATAIYGARSANGVILVTTKTGKAGKSAVNYKFKYSINKERNDQQYLEAADFLNYNRQGHAYSEATRGNPNFIRQFINGANSFAIGGNTTNSPFTTQLLTDDNRYLLSQPGWSSIPDILDPSRDILFFDNKRLIKAKRNVPMIPPNINFSAMAAVYTSLNSGVVSCSGNLKHKILAKESAPKKIDIAPLILPSPTRMRLF